MKLEEFLNKIEEGTASQLRHADIQTSKSEAGEISKTIGKLYEHFGTIMNAMDKDGFGMQKLRIAVQFEDMIHMIANVYGQADDHLAIPKRRYS